MTEHGRVAIVTGAAGGIGAGIAARLVRDGYQVVVTDRRAEPGARTAAGLGGRATFLELDVTSESAWAVVVDAVRQRFARVDVLVNNAGIGAIGPMLETGLRTYQRIVAVNQTGVWLGMRAVLPTMVAAGGGSIVNIASVCGLRGAPNLAAYAATKHAIVGLSRSVAHEVAEDGVRVNCVCPGLVDTPALGDGGSPGGFEGWLRRTPGGRPAEADEVAAAVAYLAGTESSYVTGTEIVVDHGLISGLPRTTAPAAGG